MCDFEKFRERVLKVKEPRKHKVRNSWGVYDAYKYYRKNKPKDSKYIMSESQYFAIIRNINKLLVGKLLEGNDINLPERMGRLELRKTKTYIRIENGKIKTNMPIDWMQTLKLWHEDKESYENKTLIKKRTKEVFRVYYNKSKANYNNKGFYEFSLNRKIKHRLKNLVNDNKIDAFELWEENGMN